MIFHIQEKMNNFRKTQAMKRGFAFLIGLMAIVTLAFTPADDTDKEIKFEHLGFEEALKLAKEKKKLIFIDCYTVWCGPCKHMAATAFKDDEVADVYNDQFINLKIEMQKDADGPELSRRYAVQGYPTLLIVDHNGKVVERRLGMQSSNALLDLARSVK